MGDEEKKNGIKVNVLEEAMIATINVMPQGAQEIRCEDLLKALQDAKVVYGVDTAALHTLLEQKQFGMNIEVARGMLPEDGKDGYYEYLFETVVNVKPKILKDGSVDYKSMGEVPVAMEGQELVHYHKATKAVSGKNVFGQEVMGRKGKELQALKGKGFVVSEDKTVYKAALTGKVTLKGNRLEVNNVLVVKEDVSIATGGVRFAGDIIIKGNVLTGAEVRANGNIEVNGCVEAAVLVAGKDVILKNGMQGNGKGRIHAGGNVSGKFFEQVTIEAKGNVSSNALMHCSIKSEGAVNVSGKYGIIVGGSVSAYCGIEATLIGNMNEVKTKLEVGTSEDLYEQMHNVEKNIREVTNHLEKLKEADRKVTDMLQKYPKNDELQNTRRTLMRARIAKEAELKDLQREVNEVAGVISKTTNPRITVLKSIYPGTILTINGVTQRLKTENYNVYYQKNGIELQFVANI